ncbi:MAG: ankyrin repeat domain-containing protein [Candidatus Micrarchaeota archaeon]
MKPEFEIIRNLKISQLPEELQDKINDFAIEKGITLTSSNKLGALLNIKNASKQAKKSRKSKSSKELERIMKEAEKYVISANALLQGGQKRELTTSPHSEQRALQRRDILVENWAMEHNKKLLDAAKRGNIRKLEEALESGAEVNAKDEKGKTALMHAAEKGNSEMVKLLLKHKASVVEIDDKGGNALWMAVRSNNLETAELIISEINLKDPSLIDHGCPMSVAVWNGNIPMIDLLLKYGADINARRGDGSTPLITAIKRFCFFWRDKGVLEHLIRNGADPLLEDDDGKTILDYVYDKPKLMERLLIEIFAANSDFDLNKVRKVQIGREFTLLGRIARWGDNNLIKLLLKFGANVNGRNGNQETPLMEALNERGKLSTIKLLIEKGANVNAQDQRGWAPIHHAITCVYHEVSERETKKRIEILLENGADINAKDNIGRTPLIWAVTNEGIDRIRLLLEKGARVDIKDADGKTAIDYKKESVKYWKDNDQSTKSSEKVLKLLEEYEAKQQRS